MTRRIKERNVLAVDIDAVCADVLRDAAGFARGNVCVADGVQNGGLAVVNVPMTTTTGARGTRFASSSSLSSMMRSSMVTTTSFSTFAWNSSAMSTAVSKSMVSLMVAKTPFAMSFLMTSALVASGGGQTRRR